MKWIADAEGEAFVLRNAWDVMIPVSYTKIGDELTVKYYPEIQGELTAFFRAYGENPFTDEALSALFFLLQEYFGRKGYTDDRFRDRWGYIYRGSIATPVGGAVLLSAQDEKYNKTTYDIASLIGDGRLVYGVKVDGCVVSVAVTHTSPDDLTEKTVEVGVETAPHYRGHGYATAALSALSQELMCRGRVTEYRCQRYNEASRRVAVNAGLSEVGKYYNYVGRKNHGV